MNWLRRLVSQRRLHRELAEEIQAHLEEKVEDLIEGGLSRAEAVSAARRAFGNATMIEERGREVWGWPFAETWRADVRYACRRVRRSPTFMLVSVLSIALGLGATTVVFSVIHAVLINPYPYRDADRLVHLHVFNRGDFVFDLPLSDRQFEELQGSPIVDEAMAMDTEGMSAAGGSLPEPVNAGYLSSNAFGFLGVPPLLGRPFTPEDVTGASATPQRVVVLGYGYWQKHYGARPNVLGQILRLDDRDHRIIGVMPRRFAWWDCDVYLPLEHSPDPDRLASVFVRLKPGISDGMAEPALQTLVERLSKERPHRLPPQFRIHLVHMKAIAAGPWSGTLLMLFGAVGLLLVIGCANVSILLLARGSATMPELAIRAAIGASRSRIARQLFTESIVISCAGGLLGILLARIGVDLVPRLLPDGTFPAESVVRLSGPVLVFGAALAVLTSVLFGLWPALSLSHPELNQIRRIGASRPAGRMPGGGVTGAGSSHNLLVAGQVALAVVLLATAGAAIRSFSALIHTGLDYQPRDVASVRVDLRDGTYTQWDQRVSYLDRIRRRVASSPGITSVAISSSDLPPARPFHSSVVESPGVAVQERQTVLLNEISAEYFPTLGIPLLRGRLWTESETRQAAHVAVINRSMAKRYWADRDPTRLWIHLSDLRATTTWALASVRNDGWVQIVGVAADTPNDGLENPAVPAMYIPYTLVTGDSFRLIARSAEHLDLLVRTMADGIHAIDPDQPVTQARTAEEALDADLWAHGGLTASLYGLFALMALLLAAVGLYSVVSCVVSQRTHEFGVRVALGARRTELVRMVLTWAAQPTFAGLLAGLALSVALDEVLGRWTHISARDPYVLASLVVLLVGVTTLAALVPACRAASVDPMRALRAE
jgi:putative ABC transport system permease protein